MSRFRSVRFCLLVGLLSGSGCSDDQAAPRDGAEDARGGKSANGGSTIKEPGSSGKSGSTSGLGGRSSEGSGGTSSSASGGAVGDSGSSWEDAPSGLVHYEPSNSIVLNPERGFFTTTNLATVRDLEYVRAQGKSLVYAAVHLDSYLGENHAQDLPARVLDDVQAGFAAVRAAGIKAIVRFQYDNGQGYPGGANDAPKDWIVRHIAQLAPVLQENEDVLFVLHAGFIGAWSEWHTSKNFVDGTADREARKEVVLALLNALPKSRRTELRYPAYKRMLFGTAATSEAELIASSDRARVGHLNDCFVASDDDMGTYQYEPMATLKTYLAEDTKYVPIGGETCATHARNSCEISLAEMERFHYTHLNDDYHPDVLAVWEREGCRPEIERKLGYRFSLETAELPSQVRPGGSFTLTLTLKNHGFAALTNLRPVFIVLEGQGERHTVKLDADPRTWQPGSVRITARLRLPAALASGSYRLALWIPDAASNLQSQAEYSVQLANANIWNGALGDNTLGHVSVTPDASGGVDDFATTFVLIR